MKRLLLVFLLNFALLNIQAQMLNWMKPYKFMSDSRQLPIDMVKSNKSDATYITGFITPDTLNSGVPLQNGPNYGFITKLNSTGDTLWKWINISNASVGSGLFPSAIAADSNDNIYVAGMYNASSLGLLIVVGNDTFPTTNIGYGSFIMKLDLDGNILWTRPKSGPIDYNDMDIDQYGNIYLMSTVQASIQYGSTTISTSQSNYWRDAVVSYDANGNFRWAVPLGEIDLNNTTVSDKGALINIAVSKGAVPGIYAAGYFQDPYTISTTTYTSAGQEDALIVRLDSSGNYISSRQVGGTNRDVFYDIETNKNGTIALAMTFRTSTQIFGTTHTTTTNFYEVVALQLDTSLNLIWANDAIRSSMYPVITEDDSGRVALAVGSTASNAQPSFTFLSAYNVSGSLVFSKNVSSQPNSGIINFMGLVYRSDNTLQVAGAFIPQITIDSMTLNTTQSYNHEMTVLNLDMNTVVNSISSVYPENISVYVNNREIEIHASGIIDNVIIYDCMGKQVFRGNQRNYYSVPLSASGVYIIQYFHSGNSYVRKIAVQ